MNKYKEIRLLLISSLIFSFMMTRCGQHDSNTVEATVDSVSIHWENNKPVGVLVPNSLLDGIAQEDAIDLLQVYILNSSIQSPILGDHDLTQEGVIFRPLVPFTPGLDYEVRLRGEPISQFEVPMPGSRTAGPELIVYPTSDTLPENVLKLYFEFTKPMREGNA